MEIRVCIDVNDLERGIAFYTQGLGLRQGRRLDHDWIELLGAGSAIDLRAIQDRRWGRMANLADPFGHGLDLLEFKGRGYDELLQNA
jgi:catechol 2,3-dioxygenase-like lactoylglutathione lyase family enzyme